MTITELEDFLYNWISTQLGYETIIAYPSKGRPSSLYVTINVYQELYHSTKGKRESVLPDDSIDYTYSRFLEAKTSINVYREGAVAVANIIRNSLDSITIQEFFSANNIGIGLITITEKIPEVVDLEYEERARFEVSFFIRTEYTENIELIKSIELTNEIDNTTTIIE